jgi:hypothetical protein
MARWVTGQHAATCPLGCCTDAHDPAVTGVPRPLTVDEHESIVDAIWADLEEDPYRIGDLLTIALAYLAVVALDPGTDPHDADQATAVLRQLEQRALWGPDTTDSRRADVEAG